MQISQSNYLQRRDQIDWSRMPTALTDKPKTVTDNAATKGWAEMGEQTQKATEQFFKLCNMLIAKDPSLLKGDAALLPEPEEQAPTPKKAKLKQSIAKKEKPSKSSDSKLIIDLPAGIPQPSQVLLIATHTAFIKRYVTMHGKVKTRDQIVSLLHGLQKAITEQRIRNGSPALREIQKMQSELVTLAEKMGGQAKIEINEPYLSHYRQIAQGEEVRTSVKLLKQFIQVNGKSPDKVKVEKLGKRLASAYDTIPKEDIYRDELAAGAKAIAEYVSGGTKMVGIPESALHGLGGVAIGSSVNGLGIVPGNGEGAIIRLVREEGVKNLSEATLKKAFRRTVAPGLCLEIARNLIRRGELTMMVLNHPPSKKKSFAPAGIDGGELPENGRVTDLDILELRLGEKSGSVARLSGLGSIAPAVQASQPRFERTSTERKTVAQPSGVVSARELAKMHFKTIGYDGRFKEVVGDPAMGFHMMVYGRPFQGKSSFVIELCKDLAQLNQGKVAYLALEEGISLSMQKKIIDRKADAVDGLDFLSVMPASFEGYSFIVIDSVSDRALKREQLRDLFLQNPQTCFICIFHATKEGSARGGLDYSHDMDIILKIDGHSPVIEKNRFL